MKIRTVLPPLRVSRSSPSRITLAESVSSLDSVTVVVGARERVRTAARRERGLHARLVAGEDGRIRSRREREDEHGERSPHHRAAIVSRAGVGWQSQSSRLRKRSDAERKATAKKTKSGQTAPRRRRAVAPRSTMPRTIRTKWVSGSTCAIHCAGARHAVEREHEARQQDRRQQREERHLDRLELGLRERRDHAGPSVSVAAMNERAPRRRGSASAAADRHVEQQRARATSTSVDLQQPDRRRRAAILPTISSAGPHRRRDQQLQVAALALAHDRRPP